VTLFERCFAIVVGIEGGLTTSAADPGNWTSGQCGVGECRGTCWGISAAAYPHLDIPNLTLAQAQGIYLGDYWRPIHGDDLPAELALLAFDAAVNNGVRQAVRWLQVIAEVPIDGTMGPLTLGTLHAIIAKEGLDSVCAEYLALRLWMMSQLQPGWKTFGKGWSRRLTKLPYLARTLTDPRPTA
jgi:lysozyme family protein